MIRSIERRWLTPLSTGIVFTIITKLKIHKTITKQIATSTSELCETDQILRV